MKRGNNGDRWYRLLAVHYVYKRKEKKRDDDIDEE